MGKASWIFLGLGTHWCTGFDHTKFISFLVTGLNFSQRNSQVPGEGSPPAQVVLFLWWFYSSLCFKVALVPACTSIGGCFVTSSLKLHWDSRTCGWTRCTSPLLPCKERSKGFSKHYFSFSHLNCKTCRQVPGGACIQSFKTPSLTLLFGSLNDLAWIIQLPGSSSNLPVKAATTWPCKNCVLASQLHPTCVSCLLQITRQNFQKTT